MKNFPKFFQNRKKVGKTAAHRQKSKTYLPTYLISSIFVCYSKKFYFTFFALFLFILSVSRHNAIPWGFIHSRRLLLTLRNNIMVSIKHDRNNFEFTNVNNIFLKPLKLSSSKVEIPEGTLKAPLVFWGKNFKKTIAYLKSASSNLSKCKV